MKTYEQVASCGKGSKKVNNDIELSLMINSSKMKLTLMGKRLSREGFSII